MKKVILFLSFFLLNISMFAQVLCPTPTVTAFSNDASSAVVFWGGGSVVSGRTYTLQYRKCTDTAWTSVNNLTPTSGTIDSNLYIIRNLVSCQCYVVRVRANCSATQTSDWQTKELRTLGCVEPCRAPLQLFAAPRDSSAVLNWSPGVTGSVYTVQWKLSRDTAWKTQTSTTNSLNVAGLQPCSEYEFRVKTACSATLSSEYSSSSKFKTSGCIAPCSTPREVRAIVAPDRSYAYVSWASTGARAYEVMYTAGDSAARTVLVTTNALRLSNVASCKTYKFKVRSVCSSTTSNTNVYSEWSTDVSVNTEGCPRCNAPTRLSYTVTEVAAVLKWDTIPNATYDIQWMGPRDSTWRTVSAVRGNQYSLTGLTACSWYTFRVKTNCSATLSSVWSTTVRFQTKGCAPVCTAPRDLRVYVADTIGIISWTGVNVSNFRLVITSTDNTFSREVTVAGFVYSLTGLARCKTYKVQLKALCSATSNSDIITTTFETRGCPTPCGTPREISLQADSTKVTLKWANMGASKYYIEYKLLADSLGAWKRDSATTNSLVISGLQTCKTYMVRIGALCPNALPAYSTPFIFTTTGCPAPCLAPVEFASEIVSDTTASLKFNIVTGQSYTVQYRVAGTAVWTSIQVNAATPNSLPVRVVGLLKCTTYQWRVLRTCITANIVESLVQSFTTKGCPTPCTAVPRDLVVTNYPTDSAKLTWIMPTAGLTYEVRYGSATDSSIYTATSTRLTTNAFVLRGLVACRYYIAQVRTLCPNGLFSEWVTTARFRLGASCFGEDEFSAQQSTNQQYVTEFGVYPNPGSESLQVAYKLERDANVKVELMNLQGQVVSGFDGGNQEVGNYVQALDNVAALNTGYYLVVIRANGKVVNTQKWHKQ